MRNVLVRNVPDDVHAALQRQAASRHQSLQQFLVSELRRLAHEKQLVDILDEIEQHSVGEVGLQQAVRDIEDERARR